MWHNLASAAVIGALLAGCGGDEEPTPIQKRTEGGAPRASAAVEGASDGRCTGELVERLVGAFVHALNRGDMETLDAIFAPPDSFNWYTVDGPGVVPGERGGGQREKLIPYFSRRHDAGERLRLTSFRFNGHLGGYGHFEYRLRRSADGVPPAPYGGKGAAICDPDGSLIAVWSMATVRW